MKRHILFLILTLTALPAFAGIHYKAVTKTDGAQNGAGDIEVEGWVSGDKAEGARFLAPLVASGRFAGVSAGYRLADEARWPAQLHDAQAAVRWVRANAERHGFDPDRVAAWGWSAGGHLAARSEVEAVFEMATTNAARAIGLTEYGVAVENRANLLLLDATTAWEALVAQAEKLLVIAQGRVIVENRRATVWHE